MTTSRRNPTPPAHPANSSLIGIKLHEGPLPAPTDFAAYEHIQPGAADRLLKMAELDQQAGIRDLRLQRLTNFILDVLSQSFLYCLVFAAIYLAIHDQPLEAFFAGLAPIAVTIYANTRKKPHQTDGQNH